MTPTEFRTARIVFGDGRVIRLTLRPGVDKATALGEAARDATRIYLEQRAHEMAISLVQRGHWPYPDALKTAQADLQNFKPDIVCIAHESRWHDPI